MIDTLNRILKTICRSSQDTPKTTCGIFFVLFALLLPNLKFIQFCVDVADLSQLDQTTDGDYTSQKNIRQESNSNDLSLFFSRRDYRPLQHDDLCAIKAWQRHLKIRNPYIKQINSILDFEHLSIDVRGKREFLQRQGMINLKKCHHTDISRPLDLFKKVPASMFHGLLAQDLSVLPVFIVLEPRDNPKEDGESPRFGNFKPQLIESVLASTETFFPASSPLLTQFYGGGIFEWHFWQSMLADQKLNLIFTVLFLICFRILYGHWRGGIVLVSLIGGTSLIVFSLMAMTSTSVDLLTNGLMIMVAFAAAEDFIYLTEDLRRQSSTRNLDTRTIWRHSFQRLATPSFFTSLTTMVGFASLAFSPMVSVQKFGIWAAVAAGIEWILLFMFLPAFLTLFPWWGDTFVQPRKDRWKNLLPTNILLSRHTLKFTHLIFIVCVVGFFSGKNTESIEKTWDDSHRFSQSIKIADQKLGWTLIMELNIKPHPEDPTAETRIVESIKKMAHVVFIDSQQSVVNETLQDMPNRDYYSRQIKTSSLMDRYFTRSQSPSMTRSYVFLNTLDPADHQIFIKNVEDYCQKQCYLSGKYHTQAKFMNAVISTFRNSFLLCFGIISLILWVLARQTGRTKLEGLQISYASIWGVVIFVGIAPYLWGGINVVTCIFGSVLLGLAGDNGIHYLYAARNKKLLQGVIFRQTASIYVTLFMLVASATYFFSSFLQIRNLGLLFAGGSIALLVGDLAILKSMLGQHPPTSNPDDTSLTQVVLQVLKGFLPFALVLISWVALQQKGVILVGIFLLNIIVIPILDTALGDTLTSETEDKAGAIISTLITISPIGLCVYLWVSIAQFKSEPNLMIYFASVLVVAASFGTVGLIVAHELIHSKKKWHRLLGTLTLALTNYTWFRVEHIHGHHKHVGTPMDSATARLNQNIYHFLSRSIIGGLLHSFRYESKRVQRLRESKHHLSSAYPSFFKHRLLRYGFMGVIYWTGVYAFCGWSGIIYLFLVSAVTIILIESVNYVQHYGLKRALRPNGRYEPITAEHSWNCGGGLTSLLTLNFNKHSEHHQDSSLPFYRLKKPREAPHLRFGFAAALPIAFIPPLWRLIVHPVISQHASKNLGE